MLWDANNRLVTLQLEVPERCTTSPPRPCAGRDLCESHGASPPPPKCRTSSCADQDARRARAATRRVLPDGRWLQINERRTKDGGYVSVGTDITALKRQEAASSNPSASSPPRVADLKHSRQTLEAQAQQLADLAERYLEQKARGRERQPRQIRVPGQYEP